MDDQTKITIFLLLGLATMACLTVCVVLFFTTYRKKVVEKEAKVQLIEKEAQLATFKRASEAEEKQKEKIGKNLHDGIIPKLSTVQRSIGANINDLRTEDFDEDRLRRDHALIAEVIEEIRGVSHDLVPKTLLILGLMEALKELVGMVHGVGGVETAFENTTAFTDIFPLSIDEQLTIYRICQELLNNLAKHSEFTYLKAIIRHEDNILEISVMHNGKGVTNEQIEEFAGKGSGLGLRSLRSRAMILKARIDYSILPEFSVISITLPLLH